MHPSPADIAETHASDVGDRAPVTLRTILLRREAILAFLLAAVIVANSFASPYFLNLYNLADSTFNFSEKAIIVLSMALVIIARDIDLSVAATIALTSVIIGVAASWGVGTPGLVVVGIAVGMVAGALNGFLVTAFGIPAIVVTIGTMSLYRGIPSVILGDGAITEYPDDFWMLGQGYLFGLIPWEFVIFLVLGLVFGLILHRTRYGREIFAIGNNPVAARYAGIPVDRYRFALFVINGAMAGLAAVLLTSRIGSTRPNIAMGWELEIITVVVLGGVSIMGGSGTIPGVMIAVLVMGMVTFGLTLANVPGIVMTIVVGGLLIVALSVPAVAARIQRRSRS